MTEPHSDHYIECNFSTIEELADASGAPVDRVVTLIKAGCAPGPIYVRGVDGWWSALDRDENAMPEGVGWYSPGAAWGLRRALLAVRGGASDADAAAALREDFAIAFARAIESIDGASQAFPACFAEHAVDPTAVRQAALSEWQSWIDGGYGVCLRVFTAETCVAKETIGARMKAALASDNYDPVAVLIDAETLAGLILPFAPWQRESGTPGLTIDRLLVEQALGRERPYDVRA